VDPLSSRKSGDETDRQASGTKGTRVARGSAPEYDRWRVALLQLWVPRGRCCWAQQGPLGPKSMCGQCGKWWHRHRKPLEVEYSTNREFHLEKKRKDDEIRRLKKRGGMKAVQAAQERERLLAQSTPSGSGAHGSPLFTSASRLNSAATPRKNPPTTVQYPQLIRVVPVTSGYVTTPPS
jgi:hypothetical protein